jgi:hypothetical protein
VAVLLLSMLVVAHEPNEPAPLPANPSGVEQTPWDTLVLNQCAEELKVAGVTDYTFLKRRQIETLSSRNHSNLYCYVPQSMHYRRGPGDFSYSTYLQLNCKMAVALARFEKVAQRVAKKTLGPKARISHIDVLGAYNCRRLRKHPEFQSQHSFGNALDVEAFRIRGFGTVSLKDHWWNKKTAWGRKASRFLYQLVTELRRENVFTNVLTPNFDASHENHLHLDKAPHKDIRYLDAFELATPLEAPGTPERHAAAKVHAPAAPSPVAATPTKQKAMRVIAEPTWEMPSSEPEDEQ